MNRQLDVSVLLETSRLNFAGKLAFPQSVAELARVGVERYAVDLACLKRTCYGSDGEAVSDPLPLTEAPEIGLWSADELAAAVKASQQAMLTYPDFLRRIMAAGCACYLVFITGRRVHYISREGDIHTEYFPDTK